jgi:hypothetical protein
MDGIEPGWHSAGWSQLSWTGFQPALGWQQRIKLNWISAGFRLDGRNQVGLALS